jgi:uncharacterized protein
MAENELEVLKFPCLFPIKVIGLVTSAENFQDFVLDIILRHVSDLDISQVTNRLSQGGKYMSVSAIFVAESRVQVDALYEELGKYKDKIFMIL